MDSNPLDLDQLLASLNPNPETGGRSDYVTDLAPLPRAPADAQPPAPVQVASPAPVLNAMPKPAAPALGATPDVSDYIKQKFNLGPYSDEARQKLVDANSQYDTGNHISAALAALGAGIAGGNAGAAGQGVLERADKANQRQLDAFDKGRANLVQQYGLDQQATKDANDMAREEREHDVNSNESKLAQSLAKKLMPTQDFSNMSASKINEQIPTLKSIYEGQIKLEEERNKSADRRMLLGDKSEQKKIHDQDQALQSTTQLLESARGNPAVAQAEKDLYAADKANGLLKLYPDPNKIPREMVNLYTQELGKIASGGTPTQHELEGITPNNLQGPLRAFYQKLSNNPTPANLGEFIKANQRYTNQLADDARKVIKDKYGRVIESRKSALGDDNYSRLNNQYIDRFSSSGADAGGGFPRTVSNGTHQATVNNAAELKDAQAHGFN